jgi:integrase
MSVYPHGKRWRAQPEYRGIRAKSKLFDRKSDALAYRDSAMVELRLKVDGGIAQRKTLAHAIQRYIEEIAPTHKGFRWEVIRLEAFAQQFPVHRQLADIQPAILREWIETRKSEVSAGSVLRDISLISAVFSACVRDWGWLKENPLAKVRKPPSPKHRARVITGSEIRQMLRGLGYVTGKPPESATEAIAYVFLVALRTGMRASEITGIEWEDFHGTWVRLADTKNGTERHVPLDKRTRRYFAVLRALPAPFPVAEQTRDSRFRQIRNRLGLEGFTFHDARHTAATRIGAKVGQPGRLTFPEFCRVFGWTDPRNAMIYVNPSAETLAGKL